ncbi:MAG TPA: hypothetical protein VNT42_10065 [Sphingomonas sp.]|nr:hypothetical protein [Sphingomonas sp.]
MKLFQTWAIATAIAGTLDILSAFVFGGMKGVGPVSILEYVASGPFGDRALNNPDYAIAGILVHYGIMACMVGFYLFAAQRLQILKQRPVLAGMVYGFALWILMYWIVRQLRWPGAPLPTAAGPIGVAQQLFSHLILVGIPIALIAARGVGRQR